MSSGKFPHFLQRDQMDCGPTCVKMIAQYYGKEMSLPYLREQAHIDRQGVSLLGIKDAAEAIGFEATGIRANFEGLTQEENLPCVVHWNQNHFVVVHAVKNDKVYVADPAQSLVTYTEEEFCHSWLADKDEGIGMLLRPKANFFDPEFMGELPENASFSFLFKYIKPYQKLMLQVFLGLLTGSFLALVLPFLTQALVDKGINQNDISFIYLVLTAQLMLFIGKTSIEIIRSWILLHIASRVNIFIISDFLIKLMKLPISFFDSKNLGDILQRIGDHERVKQFLTSSSLGFIFSIVNFIVFGTILLLYNLEIFLIFLIGSSLYVVWVMFFLKKRKELDFKRFNQASINQGNEVQLIQGMQEIKLNTCEKQKRWEWEAVQIRLFKISLSSLALSQYQNSGGSFINELKNILITFWAAQEVISGNMTLGMMMAAQQILGQLNAPVLQFISFIQEAQDAKISLERLNEIHSREDEDENIALADEVPEDQDIILEEVDFRYNDPNASFVLENVSVTIPHGKTTAIVGASGSGKTTLLKLLLKFYEPENGKLNLGSIPFRNLDSRLLRNKIGTVMQDGFIFSDSIANNIALTEDIVDQDRLAFACDIANIRGFIESLPLNYNTEIGPEGVSLSQGQKQRIMIARAVYKDPSFLFFDEATSALDTKNEREITEKIERFTKNKTVITIAHRLSTVKNADQIIVLDQGQVKEVGNHTELTAKRGLYFNLVKNQLELGN